jgi:hypothetical protein
MLLNNTGLRFPTSYCCCSSFFVVLSELRCEVIIGIVDDHCFKLSFHKIFAV